MKKLWKKYAFEDPIANLVFGIIILIYGSTSALVVYKIVEQFIN